MEKQTIQAFAVFAPFAVKIKTDTSFEFMNLEQREGYEQGEADHKNFRCFRVFRGYNYCEHSI